MNRPRWFGHPVIIAAIATAIAIDFASIPGRWHGGHSTIGSIANRAWINIARVPLPTAPRTTFPGLFLTRGDEVEFVWNYPDASTTPAPTIDDIASLQQDGWLPLGGASSRFEHHSGFYHMTTRWSSFAVHGAPNDQLDARLMARFVERFDELPPDDWHRTDEMYRNIRRLYNQGRQSESHILFTGYIRNTIALSLLTLLVILPFRGRTDLWLERWHSRYITRPRPGHCPACGYDARTLTQCPECGSPVKPAHP